MADKNLPKQKQPQADDRGQTIAELTAALQRERADSINMRRQYDTQLSSVRQFGLIKATRELLPAIDNLYLALKHVPAELKHHDYVKGIEAVAKQFEKVLSELGIVRIKTVGEPFDPRFHEAVHLDDSQGGKREVVSEELRAGYMLDGEVIRHAMVNVRLEP